MKKNSQLKKEQASGWRWTGMIWIVLLLGAVMIGGKYYLSGRQDAATVPEDAVNVAVSSGVPVLSTSNTIIDQGLAITFSINPLAGQPDLSELSFALTDPSNGQPVELSTSPLVWIGSQQANIVNSQGREILSCQDKIKLYLQGTLDYKPEIDLNSYLLLTLNNDPSISVIDPLGGVTGISQLFEMVELKSPGEDWVMSGDGKYLFVTLPKADQVAVVDTENFSVVKYIDSGKTPTRIAIQPDGRYIWVTNDTSSFRTAGVTVIDTKSLTITAAMPIGTGQHALTFSGEVLNLHPHEDQTATAIPEKTSFVFISNQAGTISVLDTNTLDFVASVDLGSTLAGLDYSSANNIVHVTMPDTNEIKLIDASTHEINGKIDLLTSGFDAIRFSPDGRWGFVFGAAASQVKIIDALTNQIIHSIETIAPDKVSFTGGYAYIHSAKKPDVILVDLSRIAQPGVLTTVNVIGGQTAPDQADATLAVADAIVPVHEHGGHVLITNPGDQSIYYYMEGMNAPMGSFQTYSRTPRAVQVVDRSIQLTAPGVYKATVKIPRADTYEAAIMVDTPDIQRCFSFSTAEEEDSPKNEQAKNTQPALEFLTNERVAKKGVPLILKFKVSDAQSGTPLADLSDLYVLVAAVSGQRSDRFKPNSTGQGIYEVNLTFAEKGIYKIYIAIPSLKINADDLPFFTIQVIDS